MNRWPTAGEEMRQVIHEARSLWRIKADRVGNRFVTTEGMRTVTRSVERALNAGCDARAILDGIEKHITADAHPVEIERWAYLEQRRTPTYREAVADHVTEIIRKAAGKMRMR